MKVSKTQVDCMKLMLEGNIVADIQDNDRSLNDGDGNTYAIRKSTFNSLYSNGLIEIVSVPSMDIYEYGLTQKGIDYLLEHHYEDVKDFINLEPISL